MRFQRLLFTHSHFVLFTRATLNNRQFPPAPTPPPSQPLKDNPSCQLVGEALAICDSLTPSFKDLPATSQANCLCYSSTVYAPEIFDNAIKYCADYASTAATSVYPAISSLQGFCTNIGDVAIGPATTVASQTNAGTGGYGSGACGVMSNLMAVCATQTPGFATLQPSEQAKCLCSGSFAPAAFDNAVSSCCQVARTQNPAVYSTITTLQGFCASASNNGLPPYSFAAPTSPPNNSPASTSASGTTTHSHMDVTVTIPAPTATAVQANDGPGLPKPTMMEIVWLSFGCAAVLAFL